MQSLSWYLRRLRAMSAAEIVARLGHAASDVVDRVRFSKGWYPDAQSLGGPASMADFKPGHTFFNTQTLEDFFQRNAAAKHQLLREAEHVAAHRLSFFDLEQQFLGDPIDWQRDHSGDKRGPMRLIQDTNYRDFDVFGDCKLVWEPSRHHHLVTLARAWHVSRDAQFANAAADQFDSWISANRFGYGMNWRSPLELGIRIINWVAALDLLKDSDAIEPALWQRIYHNAYLHVWEISRKYSPGSSANNHLVGELAGVFVACSYFRDFPAAQALREDALRRLEAWVADFAYDDGCTPEQAIGYQFFVLQFLLIVMHCGEATGLSVSDTYKARLESMYSFPAKLAQGGPLPMFGDQDDGYVLNLGNDQYDIDAVLAMGACALQSQTLARYVNRQTESCCWLFGSTKQAILAERDSASAELKSQTFDDSGYCLLQHGTAGASDALSVLFDCGPLGLGSLAAHGHADALSIAVRVGGHALLIDPGTYDYYTFKPWRHYFRTTAAHNTLCVDDTDQSEIQGPFLWGQRAECVRTAWRTEADYTEVAATHDGYQKLSDPVMHTRKVTLQHAARELQLVDTIDARQTHTLDLYFHCAPDCEVDIEGITVNLRLHGDTHQLILPSESIVETWRGSEDPIAGWHSPRYHIKEPATTIRARLSVTGEAVLRTVLKFA
ncbi:MAG: alginate lyase family protein [Pseudomonadota bacterium]